MYTPPINKKPVHLVKNYTEVPEKQRWAEALWGQEKIDGCYAYGLMIPGDNRIFSRTGEHVLALKHLEEELSVAAAQFKPSVCIFEVHRKGWSVNKISGAFRRQSVQFTEAVARIHDVIPYDDFVAGQCDIPYRLRYVAADFVSQVLPHFTLIESFVVADDKHAVQCANEIIQKGGEGLVLKRATGVWKAGKKDVNMMKIKQEESWDLEVTELEEGKGKYIGTLGKLVCRWRLFGKSNGEYANVYVSGMTDKQRNSWWSGKELIVGEIVQVDAMCITPYGMLREPRFKQVRTDKLKADV